MNPALVSGLLMTGVNCEIVMTRMALPAPVAFVADIVTVCGPAVPLAGVPEMIPVSVSIVRPVGNPTAL